MTLDEFRKLNPKDIGIWPWPAKAAALIFLFSLLIAAAWYFGWSGQMDELDQKTRTEATLKQEYSSKKAQAINLDLYIQQLKEVEQQFGALLRQLPGKNEMDSLLSDINQAGLGRGLNFELFKPAGEREEAFYAELPVNIRVTGAYHDIGGFASEISQLSRIVTLNDIALTSKDPKDQVLTMEAVAKTFRYLDEDELAAQRKANEAKKAQK